MGYRFAVAHREQLQHLHRPRRLPRVAEPDVLRPVQRPGRRDRRRRSSSRISRPTRRAKSRARACAVGQDWVLRLEQGQHVPLRLHADRRGHASACRPTAAVSFRFIDDFERAHLDQRPRDADPQLRQRLQLGQGRAHAEVRHEHAVHAGSRATPMRTRSTAGLANGSWVAGVGRRYMPGARSAGRSRRRCDALPAVACGLPGRRMPTRYIADARHHLADHRATYNYLTWTAPCIPVGEPTARKYGSDEYEFYAQDSWKLGRQPHGHRRPALQPLLAALRSRRPAGRARTSTSAIWLEHAPAAMMLRRASRTTTLAADRVRPGRTRERQARASTTGTRTTSRRASRWRGRPRPTAASSAGSRAATRWSSAAATRSSTTASARRWPRSSTHVGSFGLSTQSRSARSTSNNEDNPDIRFQSINDTAEHGAGSAAWRLPADAAAVRRRRSRRRSTARSRRRTPTPSTSWSAASSAATTASRRPTSAALGRNLLIRRDLMMPLNLDGPAVGRRLLHGRRQADRRRASQRPGDPLEHRADPVLGEPVPRCGVFDGCTATQNDGRDRSIDDDAGLHHGALGRRPVLLPGVAASSASSRSSTRSTTRWPR